MNREYLLNIIDTALKEDLGQKGDITTKSILTNEKICFAINTREELVVCGIPILEEIMLRNKNFISYNIHKTDGALTGKHTTIVSGTAVASHLLSIERVILNFLQHASGVASITKKFVDQIKGTKAKIRDTRKTTPGLRMLEKYAVRVGGGYTHRTSLEDIILIKDNHIATCGSITTAVKRVRDKLNNIPIIVECDTISQVEEALSQKVNTILLDNMNVEQIQLAASIAKNSVILEASGGINLENVRSIAETGVDYISVGCITHSFPNKDIGLDISCI